jgi:hypothetical protein
MELASTPKTTNAMELESERSERSYCPEAPEADGEARLFEVIKGITVS